MPPLRQRGHRCGWRRRHIRHTRPALIHNGPVCRQVIIAVAPIRDRDADGVVSVTAAHRQLIPVVGRLLFGVGPYFQYSAVVGTAPGNWRVTTAVPPGGTQQMVKLKNPSEHEGRHIAGMWVVTPATGAEHTTHWWSA